MKLRFVPPSGGGALVYKFVEIGLVALAIIPISILGRDDLCELPGCGSIEVGMALLWYYGVFNAIFLYLPVSLFLYARTLKPSRTLIRALMLALASGCWATLSWMALGALFAPGGDHDFSRDFAVLRGYPALSVLTVFLSSFGAGLTVLWLERRR